MATGISKVPDSRIAVGVYDESELVVSGVQGLLGRHPEATVVHALRPRVPAPELDVVLCDPFGRPVEVEDYLRRMVDLTPARVIVYSWHAAPASVRRVLAAGAAAYVSKTSSATDLFAAVDAVHRGAMLVPLTAPCHHDHDRLLSTRESEVLALICRGMSNLEIAAELYVSVNSVKTYIRQVYAKIDVSRRAQAVAWGIARGF